MNSTFERQLNIGRNERYLLLGLLLLFFTIILARNAWVAEDAYITFRTVDNYVNGYGLTWNVGERVQAYTHPMWMFVVASFYFFTREAFFTSLFISFLFSILTLAILAFNVARSTLHATLAITILVLSKAFIDFSASGLENPLTHLLLILFFSLFLGARQGERKLFALSLLTALGAFNRMDTILFFLPALALNYYDFFTAFPDDRRRGAMLAVAGFLPFILWELFSLIYYGFPVPNTAFAKLNNGLPQIGLLQQGLYYLLNSIMLDPITLATITFGFFVPFATKDRRHVAIAFGAALYLAYLMKIGGDHMSGRFLTGILLCSVILVARFPFSTPRTMAPFLVIALVLGLLSPRSPLLSGQNYGEEIPREDLVDDRGIADERATYYQAAGLLNASRSRDLPDYPWAEEGKSDRHYGDPVTVKSNIGYYGYFAGPDVYIIDTFALSDPLLGRLQPIRRSDWIFGHFDRKLPEGYRATITSGENRLADPGLARYYDVMMTIVRGDFWEWQRFVEIVKINLGWYSHLVDPSLYRYGGMEVRQAEISEPRKEGYPFDGEGTVIFDSKGVQVMLDGVSHRPVVETTLDNNDEYELIFLQGRDKLGSMIIGPKLVPGGGLARYQVPVPQKVAETGYDRVIILPHRGDNGYSIGHLRLLD